VAAAEILRRSLTKRGWMSEDTHRDLFAISRLTPGTNLLAYCTAVGWRLHGVSGAVVALVASSVPSAAMCVLAYVAYEQLTASPLLSSLVLVGMTVAILLLGSSAWHLATPVLAEQTPRRAAVLVSLAVIATLVGVSPMVVLLTCGAVGGAWPRR
jgi:chromate transporter